MWQSQEFLDIYTIKVHHQKDSNFLENLMQWLQTTPAEILCSQQPVSERMR
jgi:hypothetical protein